MKKRGYGIVPTSCTEANRVARDSGGSVPIFTGENSVRILCNLSAGWAANQGLKPVNLPLFRKDMHYCKGVIGR
jgi:hypothetical protein